MGNVVDGNDERTELHLVYRLEEGVYVSSAVGSHLVGETAGTGHGEFVTSGGGGGSSQLFVQGGAGRSAGGYPKGSCRWW